jgi:rod shape determining protein RodA
MDFKSQSAHIDDLRKTYRYVGQVRMTQGTRLLTADNVVIQRDAAGFSKSVATGTTQKLAYVKQRENDGKGWMEGTQAHLDFIPERTSDFLFAVFSEEFGFVGNLVLLALYTALIGRSFYIAAFAETRFSRLLAGAIGCIFFTYTFVNMGMVSGILPVVGVPLPFMSYGGTALLILGVCTGILLSVSAESKH